MNVGWKTVFVLAVLSVVECRQVQIVSKEGRCPDESQDGVSTCVSDCGNDLDCEDDMKCCSNSCGQYTCAQPVDEMVCHIPCPRIYDPVCGSDGQTYSSGCTLNFTTCTRNQQFVHMVHEGPCKGGGLDNRGNQAKGPCEIALEDVKGPQKMQLIGAKIPQCDSEGYYKAMQCWGSVGMCGCVDRMGNEISQLIRGALTIEDCLIVRAKLQQSP